MTEIEIPLDEIIEEARIKRKLAKKQCDDFRKAFLADKDRMASLAVENLIRKEEVKEKVPRKWE